MRSECAVKVLKDDWRLSEAGQSARICSVYISSWRLVKVALERNHGEKTGWPELECDSETDLRNEKQNSLLEIPLCLWTISDHGLVLII